MSAPLNATAEDWLVVRRSVAYLILAECDLPFTLPGQDSTAPAPVAWLDTSPMLTPHEHCGSVIDWHRTVLAFAAQHGIVAKHPQEPHLVRVVTEEPGR